MSSLIVMVQHPHSGVILMEANIESTVILAAFPDYGAGKSLCCHLIANCVAVPDYGAGNTLDVNFFIARGRTFCLEPWVGVRIHDALEVHVALGLHGPWELLGGCGEALL